ncbi:hypothetical protein ACS0TY_023947 [Phlomoides rotata]
MTTTSISRQYFDDDSDSEFVKYYNVLINGKNIMTTVTSNAETVRQWILELQYIHRATPFRLIVGLDIKLGAPDASASASASTSAPPLRPVALLLLCVNIDCLIFQLAHANNIPQALYRFLSHDNHTFVGAAIESKLVWLRRDYGIGGRTWHQDLGALAASRYNRPELNDGGLTRLRTFLHGSDVERPPVADIWDDKELSNEHVHRACIDTYTCYEIGSILVTPVRRGTRD